MRWQIVYYRLMLKTESRVLNETHFDPAPSQPGVGAAEEAWQFGFKASLAQVYCRVMAAWSGYLLKLAQGRRGLARVVGGLLVWALAASPAAAALSLSAGTDPFGNACDVVSWTDAAGQPRTVWIKNTSPGGFITRYTYYANGTLTDARVRENYPPWGFCVLVNHWHPDNAGYFSTSCESQFITVPLTRSIPFQGPNHLIWQGTFRMQIDPNPSDANNTSYYNTVQYLFVNGRNDFIFSTAYDCSDMPQANMWSDNRSPYGDFDFDGNGSANESISGLGWGTLYKFQTTGSTLSINSAWQYTQPNTVPYIWEWKDQSMNDREFGVVQNQPYKDQNAGFEVHNSTTQIPPPPCTGTGLPTAANYYAGIAYQLNCIGISGNSYTGERFTWGSNYQNTWGAFGGKGVFQEGHGEAFNQYSYGVAQNGFMQYPVNAWSFAVLIDAFSAGGVPALVKDTENAYASTLSAAQGSVVTTGPRGPGNYVAPATGSMPTVTYSRPGFDFINRAWTLQAASGQVDCTLSVPSGGSLSRPSFILKGMSGLACGIQLNGVAQVEGTDVFSSFDLASGQLYITFNKDFSAGANHVVVQSNCASTTATPSALLSASSTPTASPSLVQGTPTYTFTLGPTPTSGPTPSCASNPNPLILQPNQHIVFMGDSITFRGNYIKQVEKYLNTRFPSYNLTYTNTGVGGWTANNALTDTNYGLQHVLSLHPDVVTICFGMNDAGYKAFDQTLYNTYTSSMTQIVNTLLANNIKVVLLTPGMVDLSVPWAANPSHVDPSYNSVLNTYGQWVLQFAASKGIPAFDVHNLAMNVNAAARAAHTGYPSYTDNPQDGIHPNPSGGLVYAYGLLTALGVPYECRSLQINASGAGTASAGLVLGDGQAQGNGCSFSLSTDPMPYIGNPQSAKILPFLDFQQKFNNIQFTVTGLTAQNYYIVVDGYRAGPVSAAALASGVNLLDYWIPEAQSPTQVHNIQLLDAAQFSGPACYNTLIDDMEHSNDFPPTPNNITWPENTWGGYWYGGSGNGGASTSSPSPLVMTAPGYNSPLAAHLSGSTNLNTNLQLLLCYVYTQYDDPKGGIEFWFKGTANQLFRVQAHIEYEDRQNPALYTDYGYNFTATGNWQLVDVPWSAMSQPSWASGSQVFSFDPGQITTLEWLPYFTGNFDMAVDNLSFLCANPAPLPTSTATPCPSCNPSATPTLSATPSMTLSATLSASASTTPTISPSATLSAGSSTTPTISPSATLSASSTVTQSGTLSVSATVTGTATGSASPWATGTISPSVTISSSVTASVTPVPSATTTPSDTPVPAGSSATATPSVTPVFSASPTGSTTPTLSATPSMTLSATLSAGSSATLTASASPTPTSSATGSATTTLSSTVSVSVTGSPTATATRSLTARPTLTATPSLTRVITPTFTLSGTPRASFTASPSAILPSSTATALASPSATLTVKPSAEEGPFTLELGEVVAVPNPNPQSFCIELKGGAERCGVDIYSVAMLRLGEASGPGRSTPGWVSVDASGLKLPSGTYFVRAWAEAGGQYNARPVCGRFVILK